MPPAFIDPNTESWINLVFALTGIPGFLTITLIPAKATSLMVGTGSEISVPPDASHPPAFL
ncbi:MAG TPA: hypothetical protein VJZ78_05920 [Anaerolineales bacterium]|nr:hypothetical protein [Anaerolineales bacterium]